MLRIITWVLLTVAGIAVLIVGWQLLFPRPAHINDMRDYGLTPELLEPRSPLIPTIRPARATRWGIDETPSPASGLRITAFARDLDHPRWLYVLPNGDVLVAESNAPATSGTCNPFTNWIARKIMSFAGARTVSADRITLLRDSNGDGVADESHVFLDELHSPFGMALVNGHLYVANADAIVRYPYTLGTTSITAAPEMIVDLPSGRNHHWTKNIIANAAGDSLFVTVGSNSNVGECGPEEETGRAAIHKLNLSTGILEPFAEGLRNPNGMAIEPSTGELWTVVNERDEIGGDLVPDYITSVGSGDYFGWPYLYYGDHPQPKLNKRWPADDRVARKPDYAVGNHTASLDIVFTNGSSLPEEWRDGLVVSQHGSWNRKPRSGYRLIFIPFENGNPVGDPREVLGGFLDDKDRARGRPVGVALDMHGALLVADDVGNVIWRVY